MDIINFSSSSFRKFVTLSATTIVCAPLLLAMAAIAQPTHRTQTPSPVPELMPVYTAPDNRGFQVLERLGNNGDVLIVTDDDARVEMVFRDRDAADDARRLRTMSNASLAEIYLHFGGAAANMPTAFKRDHKFRHATSSPRPQGSLDREFRVPEDETTHYGIPGAFCFEENGTTGCGLFGDVRIGLIAASLGPCDPDDSDPFEAWEYFLTQPSQPIFGSPPFNTRVSLFGDQNQFGFGRATGDANITIPPVARGVILFCNRPAITADWLNIAVEEELFPNAWFRLWEDGTLSGVVYGMAFQGEFLHQSIRIRVRYDDPASPESEFFWAASY